MNDKAEAMPRLGFCTFKQSGTKDDLHSAQANPQVTPPSAVKKSDAYKRNQHYKLKSLTQSTSDYRDREDLCAL